MSKKYNIRWKDSDIAELNRVVKNFNAKITRLEKKDPKNIGALPERISAQHLKELIATRQDLNRELNALKRFSRRGAEELTSLPEEYNNDIIKITKWQRTEMLRRANIINARREQKRKEIAQIEMTDAGKQLGYRRGDFGMGSVDDNALEPIKPFTRAMNQIERRKKFSTLMRESMSDFWDKRDEMLKSNYIDSLEQNYRAKDVEDIKKAIRDMPMNVFRKIFEAEGGAKIFEWSYPPSDDEYQANLKKIKSIWKPNKKE